MKIWLRFFLGGALALIAAAAAHAQSLSPTGISASPGSVLPGDSVTYSITVNNGAGTAFAVGSTANFTVVFTNTVTGASFTVNTGNIAPTGGFIAAAATDPNTGQVTPGTGTFTATSVVPTQATHAGTYRAAVTLNNTSLGAFPAGVGTALFTVSSSVLTITGKPDLQITSLSYPAGTSYVGGNVIPMSLTFRNNSSTNGVQNVPFTPDQNGHPSFIRIQVVLSTNPTWGDADDLQLTLFDISPSSLATVPGNGGSIVMNADGANRTISWNQVLPGNFTGSYYVLAKVDSLNQLTQNDPPVQTVNGNNVWGGNALNPTGTLINLLSSNFPATALASHATAASTSATGYSDNPSLSSDGRYMTFASDAANLVTGDTNSARDIFLFDSQTSLVRRLSVSQQGSQGNGASNAPVVSGDGRYVAFASEANNLIVGDTNGFSDIYAVDVITGLISRMSVATGGTQANNPSFRPAISQTGRFIVFESTATNLDAAYTVAPGSSHIYIRDRDVSGSGVFDTAGNISTRLVDVDSVAPTTTVANSASIQAAISADGTLIGFASRGTNLVAPATTAARQHVYVRARANVGTATSGIKLLSVANTTAAEGNANSQTPSLSSDGHYIAFASLASNLVAGDTNRVSDIFVYDNNQPVGTPIVRRMSVNSAGGEGYDPSSATTAVDFRLGSINPTISSDGRYVAFASLDANLTTGDSIGQYQGSGATVGVTVAGGITGIPVITGGAGYSQWSPPVVIITETTGEPTTAATAVANISAAGVLTSVTVTSGGAGYTTPVVTIGSDANRALDIFVRDRDALASGTFDGAGAGATTTQMASRNTFGYQTYNLLGIPSTAASNIYPVLSANGRFVAFPSDAESVSGLAFGATNQLQLDSNTVRDVFLFDRRTNASVTPATPPTVTITSPGNGSNALVNTPISVTASATTTIGVVATVQFFVNGTSLGTSSIFPYSQTWTPTAVGSYTLSALVTDSFGNVGVSSNITVTINAAPSVGITSPVAGSAITVLTATPVTAVAAASNPGATITSVQFFANGQAITPVSTVVPPAALTVTWTPASTGTFNLTVVATDSIGTQTTSPVVAVTVNAAGGGGGGGGGGAASPPPTVSLNPAPPAGATVNAPISLSATAQAATGFVLSSVQYFANGVSIGSAIAFPYRISWIPAALGTYTITAVATDNMGTTATSTGATVVVSAGAAPTIALTSPTNGTAYALGGAISLSAQTSLGAGLIAGVEFFANGVLIGSKPASAAGQGAIPFFNLAWQPAASGTYVFTAAVTDTSGNRTVSTSVTTTVTSVAAPTVSLTSPTSGATLNANATVSISAGATAGSGASIAAVQFFVNGQSLGTSTAFPYGTSWTPTSPGTYNLSAVATDSFGAQSTSGNVSVTVNVGSSSLPTVYLTSTPNGSTVTANTPVFVTANASDPDGTVTNVEFYANGQLVGSKATAPYFTVWTPTAAGAYSLTAVAIDDAGNRVTSTASAINSRVLLGVAPAAAIDFNNPTVDTPTAGSTTAPVALFTPIKVDYGSKLIISADAVDQDGSIANIQFFANGTSLATISAAPYYTTYTLNTLSDVVITAIATDNSGNAIYTAPILISTQPSNPAGDLVTLVSPLNNGTYTVGGQIIFSATHNFGTANPPKIDFYVNGAQFTTVKTPTAGSASAPYQFIAGLTRAGTYDIHAVLRLGNTTTISAPTRITVTSNTAPTISIRSPATGGSYVVGTSLTIAASAADVDGTIQSVQFFVNGSALTTASAAPYNATWSPASPGNYSLTAAVTDDAGNQTLSSPVTVTFTGNAPPAVALSTPSTGARIVAGSPIPLVASASDGDGTISSVRFLANGVVVGNSSSLPYSATWTPTAAGVYSVVAQATDNSGNVTNSSSVAVNVSTNQAPSVSLTTPSSGTTLRTGAPAGLAANASDPDGTVASVQFLANGNVVGTSTTAPYTFAWAPSAAGTYTLAAQATDNTGNVTTSPVITVTVLANQSPSVSLTSLTNGAVVRAGSGTSLVASAADIDGTVANVQFFANGASLGAPVTALPYRTQWTPAAEGIYTITVTALDNSGASSTSSITVLAVNPATGGADTVFTGGFQSINETGSFALINMRGKNAAFIGLSTAAGVSHTYFYPSIPLDSSGGFTVTDALGRSLITGSAGASGVSGTIDGSRLTFIGVDSSFFPATSTVGTGYYTGNLTGRAASTLAAIIGYDGSIFVYAADGAFQAAGNGKVDSTGSFNLAASNGGRFTGKADPVTGFLTGSLSGTSGGGFIGAVSSGVSFSDGFLRNLSTRGQVGTGETALMAGFVVGGTVPKQVLIRAIGPSLSQFGVTGFLANPQLQLFAVPGNALITSNDNWGGAPALVTASAGVGAFPLAANSLDAVVVATLAPGNYSANITGVGGTTGIALVELYDVDNQTPFSSQKVMNVSTRGVVNPGQGTLIAGFVVSGNTSKKLLIRGVGPTLSVLGVNGALADPLLRIFRPDNTIVRENDNWETGNDPLLLTDAATKVGAFKLAAGGKDAAILINLPPGTYNAQVSGNNNTSGVALIEVYEIP